MARSKRVRTALQWSISLALIAAVFGASFMAAFFYGLGKEFKADALQSPMLKGKPLDAAQAFAKAQGLTLAIRERKTSADAAAGVILDQDPPVGTPMRKAQPVFVVVSAGKAAVEAPALAGLPQRDAESKLAALKLKAGQYSFMQSSSQAGKILAQSPEAGAPLIEGESVALLIGRTPPPARFVMPDLRGRTADDARAFFTAKNFAVSLDGPGGGKVRRQFPPAGAPLIAGTQVRLESGITDLSDVGTN